MPLRASKAVTIDSPDYFTKLVVRPVRRDDSGEYTVTAVNSSGKDTVTINVIVTAKPNKPEGPLQVSCFYAHVIITSTLFIFIAIVLSLLKTPTILFSPLTLSF